MKTTTKVKSFFAIAGIVIASFSASAQLAFTNSNAKLIAGNMFSGCSVAVTDINFDGLDDIIRLNNGTDLNIEMQNADGTYSHFYIMNSGNSSAWAMTVADVDQNGWKDVMVDAASGIIIVKLFGGGGSITSSSQVLPNSGFFLQNATFCDMNNDGWIDLFACDDNAPAHVYMNDGAGNLLSSTYVDFAVNPTITYGNDPADSGNYGSTWIDFDNDGDLDLYVAHCRQSTSSPTDLRRINRLFVNDGTNHYTEQAANFGIDQGWQTWTASFNDIDNDGDLDLMLTNHDHTSQILENDGTGHFTELTNTNFNTTSITPIESVLEDFDNDGFVDIMVAGSDWVYWKNNGDKTFSPVTGLFATGGMLSFATGDLNHDGFIDLYTSYGNVYTTPSNTPDALYLNNKNGNHFITFDLKGTVSNISAVGARVSIYGPWGTQVREVRAGESYGTCNSSQCHFGLGAATMVDSAIVQFPSGIKQRFTNLTANQFVTVIENTCSISGNVVQGASAICNGQNTTLSASPNFSTYNWSNGETTQSISVNVATGYSVTVSNGTCSNISPTVALTVNPDETPTVTAAGELVFCHGGSVTLNSTAANGYLWSNNAGSNQNAVVTESGLYTVTIQGVCGSFTSAPILVDVLNAPLPVASGTSISSPQAVTLNATGDQITWYDQSTGGTLLYSGSSYTTPIISTPTTFWVENEKSYPGAISLTGMSSHQGTNYSGGTTNGTVDFIVTTACTLNSVKVYTDSAGVREIQLLDASNVVVNSALVNIPTDSSRVNLNFALAPGTYHLTTNAAVNTNTLGTASPRLQRSSAGVAYPYSVNNLLSINGSNQGANYYYYFYDWEVQEQSYFCTSDRVPVLVDVTTGINNPLVKGISVYPNPAKEFLTIETDSPIAVRLFDAASRILRSDKFQAVSNKMNISDLAAGIYQLQIIKGDQTVNYKIVVR